MTRDESGPTALLARRARGWLAAVAARVSRRRYEKTPAQEGVLRLLEEACQGFRPSGAARVELVREAPPGVFRGIVGAYGSVRGAPHCLVMVGPEDGPAEVGYVGEAAVLEATALGLGTCWVGGLFDRPKAEALVKLPSGERVFAVSPVGQAAIRKAFDERFMSAIARSRSRKSLDAIAPEAGSWPAWARAGAEAARLAPSALNRQPWRFAMDGRAAVISADSAKDTYHIPKRLDCGIAMLHFELGARGAGAPGTWRIEKGARVALYVPCGEVTHSPP